MHQLNYIILAHKNISQLKKLIISLNDINVRFYIHIDLNCKIDATDEIGNFSNVTLINERVECKWGDFSIVKATLMCVKQILLDSRTGHTILLSGLDYPILSKSKITFFFQENKDVNFIDCRPIENVWPNQYKYRIHAYKHDFSNIKADFVCIPSIFALRPRGTLRNIRQLASRSFRDKNYSHLKILKHLFVYKRPPKNVTFYGGSQWWALTNSTLKSMIEFLDLNPEFILFFKNSLIPDEVFFQTILMHLTPPQDRSNIKGHITYTRWESSISYSPDTFHSKDIDEIIEASTSHCFARKFDESIDENIFDLIDTFREKYGDQ